MKSSAILLFLLVVLIAMPAMAGNFVQQIPTDNWRIVPLPGNELDEDSTMYLDDFEGADEWTSTDLTGVGTMWHTSSFNAYNGGVSWWCGDEALQGYNNHWLQYLETPELDLSGALNDLELNMMFYLDCEEPGGEPVGYDGWDGANVWYSTDGGATWDVLTGPSVPYQSSSLYSFGVEFGMGQGIAGWNGSQPDVWTAVNFDLSAFAGEASFMLRFAFCSDPAWSTPDAGYTSFFIDDVDISDSATNFLFNDAENTPVPADFNPIEQVGNGNTWSMVTDIYHSATHAWQMDVQNNLLCAIVSPSIDIPADWPITYLQYWVWCDMPDSDGDNDGYLDDYYAIDVSADGGVTWNMVVYDYGYDNGSGNSLDGWVLRANGLVGGVQTESIDLSPWAGQTVQLRFRGITDGNDDGGVGTGLHIDDVEVVSSSGYDYDIAVNPPYIPFPTSVNRPVPATVMFSNLGNNTQTFDSFWSLNNVIHVFPQTTLNPGEDMTYNLDADPNDGIDNWVPVDVGLNEIYARHTATPDDNTLNNITATYPVEVTEEGVFELGYDDRIPMYTTSRFGVGEGPLTHFNIPDDLSMFQLDSLRIMWNGDIAEIAPVSFNVHVYEGGFTPGSELFSGTFQAEDSTTYPNWNVLDMAAADLTLEGDFWVWFELTTLVNNDVYPHIVFSPRSMGEGHHYEYDGVDITDGDADWMIRALGVETTLAVTIDLTPAGHPPIIIPPEGGDLVFDATIENHTPNPLTFGVWTEVIMPNGNPYGPLINVPQITLPGGGIIQRDALVQEVPAGAPAGDYLYVANIGIYPNFVYTSDSFAFTKEAGAALGEGRNNGWAAYGWDVEDVTVSGDLLPQEFAIDNIYPNPFNPSTTVSIAMPAAADLKVAVYNVMGQRVAMLADGRFSEGYHNFTFNGSTLSSGIYFVQATVPGHASELRKVILMK